MLGSPSKPRYHWQYLRRVVSATGDDGPEVAALLSLITARHEPGAMCIPAAERGHRKPVMICERLIDVTHKAALDPKQLATLAQHEQKDAIGKRLYDYILVRHPTRAAKITGMFLEKDNEKLLLLLQSGDDLDRWVMDANRVLDSL